MKLHIKLIYRAELFVTLIGLTMSLPVFAQPEPPKELSAPPSTITESLQMIESPRRASMLKMQFLFWGRTRQSGVKEAWEQLDAACKSAPPLSKRWYLLQNIKAMVSPRLSFVNPKVGASTYSEIFDTASQASKSDAEYVILSSINEYLFSLGGKLQEIGVSEAQDTTNTTVKAWEAYIMAQSYQSPDAKRVTRPDWIAAFEQTGFPIALKPILETQLKASTVPSYDVLSVASYGISFENPNRALELLIQAKTLLPKDSDNKVNIREANSFFDRLIKLYQRNQRYDEAILAARERVSTLNTGRVALAMALQYRNDAVGLDALIAELGALDMVEEEISGVADYLFRVAVVRGEGQAHTISDEASAKRLVTLLNKYLSSDRHRSDTTDLTARLYLGDVLLAQGQAPKARKIVAELPYSMDEQINMGNSQLVQRLNNLKKRLTP